ncbi:MAG TPA: DUF1549 and DUF1553 domain-containing protein [Planctomycetota bacterium]|jgi:hypothetical protein|nr:DUF1549 and DUF1553 domain-containing protein [Planctomycetota bacterium]
MRTAFLALLAVALVPAGWAQEKSLSGPALIDHWVRAKWEELGIKPAPRAGDAEFLRRVYLDLVGVIPSAEEAERFLSDTDPGKRAKLVETLLRDRRYAEHWATVWSGILVGFDNERVEQLARAKEQEDLEEIFTKNVPYDEFARRVITVDGAVYDRPAAMMEGSAAKDLPDEVGLASYLVRLRRVAGNEFPHATAGKLTRVFMGVQIQCAQCHDHPFDKWTQEEFYGMASFFTGVTVRAEKIDDKQRYYIVQDLEDRKLEGNRREKIRGMLSGAGKDLTIPNSKSGPIKAAFLETGKGVEPGLSRRESFARHMTAKDNLQFARMAVNRYWAQFFGAGIVHPPDDFNGRNKPTHPELLDALAQEFIAKGYDLRWLIRTITASEAYNLTSRSPGKDRDPQAEKYLALHRVRALAPEPILRSVAKALHLGEGALARRLADLRKERKDDKGKDGPGMMGAADLMRDRVLQGLVAQFRFNFGDDEGGEVAEFAGTIPSALLMMNHPILMGTAASLRRGTGFSAFLARHATPEDKIRAVYLSALSRPPTAKEMSRWKGHVQRAGDAGYEDLLWTLLNTSEFLFNH